MNSSLRLRKLPFSNTLSSITFKKIFRRPDSSSLINDLPESLRNLIITKNRNIFDIFTNCNLKVLVYGDMEIMENSAGSIVPFGLGVVISSGVLYVYEYNDTISNLILDHAIYLLNSVILFENDCIHMKSPTKVTIKLMVEETISDWYKVLSKFCHCSKSKITSNIKPSLSLKNRVSNDVYPNMKLKVNRFFKSFRMSDSACDIGKNSWFFDSNILTKSRNNEIKSPEISSKEFDINDEFYVKSKVLARISDRSLKSLTLMFIEMFATLRRDQFLLKSSSDSYVVWMKECSMETIKNLNRCVRIISQKYVIDIQLTSKDAYEKWTIALMRIFAYHKSQTQSGSLIYQNVEPSPNVTPTPSKVNSRTFESSNNVADDKLVMREQKEPKTLTKLKRERSSFTHADLQHNSIVRKKLSEPQHCSQLFFSTDSTYEVVDSDDNDSSCNHSQVFNLESTDRVQELKNTCCDFQQRFGEIDNSFPLPIRCTKHTGHKRILQSWQNLARRINKQSQSNKLDMSSKRFKSESDIKVALHRQQGSDSKINLHRPSFQRRPTEIPLSEDVADEQNDEEEIYLEPISNVR